MVDQAALGVREHDNSLSQGATKWRFPNLLELVVSGCCSQPGVKNTYGAVPDKVAFRHSLAM